VRILAAIALLLALAAAPARAQSGNPDIDKGVALYKDLEYEKAIELLTRALAAPDLSREEKVAGYQHLAMAHLALRQEPQARAAFRALLEADRDFILPADASQTAREVLDDVARSMPKPVRATAGTDPAARAGAALTVTVQVTDAGGRDARLIVHHRVRGGKSWSTVTGARGPAAWTATIPGAFVAAPAIEYWVQVVDAAGAELTTAGSAAAPLVAPIGDRPAGGGGSVLGKWWFWTGAGAVVVAGVVGGILLFGGDDGGGGDATVIITVEPPP
jgi:tetratricopeptide (TPR) repeat protein